MKYRWLLIYALVFGSIGLLMVWEAPMWGPKHTMTAAMYVVGIADLVLGATCLAVVFVAAARAASTREKGRHRNDHANGD